MADCLKLDEIHVVHTMVIHWKVSILRQAVTFGTLYLRAQMEFEGMVRNKINIFYTPNKLRASVSTSSMFLNEFYSPSYFRCKKKTHFREPTFWKSTLVWWWIRDRNRNVEAHEMTTGRHFRLQRTKGYLQRTVPQPSPITRVASNKPHVNQCFYQNHTKNEWLGQSVCSASG